MENLGSIMYLVVVVVALSAMGLGGKLVPKKMRRTASHVAIVAIGVLVVWGFFLKTKQEGKEGMAQRDACMKGCVLPDADSGNCTGEGKDRRCSYTCNLPPDQIGKEGHCQYDSQCKPCGQVPDPQSEEASDDQSPSNVSSVPGLTIDAWPRAGCSGPLALKISMPENTCSKMLIKGQAGEGSIERYVRFDGDCKRGGTLKSWLPKRGGCTGHPYKQTRVSSAELSNGKCHDGDGASLKIKCGPWKPGDYGPGFEPADPSDDDSGEGPSGSPRNDSTHGRGYPGGFNRGYDVGYDQAYNDAYEQGFRRGRMRGRKQGCPHQDQQHRATCPTSRLSCQYRSSYQPPPGSFGSPLNARDRCSPSVTGAFADCGPGAANGGCYRGQQAGTP